MTRLLLLLLLASPVAHPAEVYTLKAGTVVCRAEAAYEEQSILLSAGLADAVPGCGELLHDVRAVVLDMRVFGPSYVRTLNPVAYFWVGTTELER